MVADINALIHLMVSGVLKRGVFRLSTTVLHGLVHLPDAFTFLDRVIDCISKSTVVL
jgi:hypothetical protein